MKLLFYVIVLLFYISTINSTNNDLDKQILSVASKLEKAENKNSIGNIYLKILKGSPVDYESQKGIPQNLSYALNKFKDGNAEELYKKLMLGWNQKTLKGNKEARKDEKDRKTSKNLVFAEPMQPNVNIAYHPDSKKIVALQQTLQKKYNIAPEKFFEKATKLYPLATPNALMVKVKQFPFEQTNLNSTERYNQDLALHQANVILTAKKQGAVMKDFKSPSKIAYKDDAHQNRMKVNRWINRRADYDTSYSSSSREIRDWKDEFKAAHLKKKQKALSEPRPEGDQVNMVAARPRGVPCGDPNQHDLPWGSCTLAAECESEYRIYRGDLSCGRSEFVCCAILSHNYDMNVGLDISFNTDSMETDSADKRTDEKDKKKKRNDRNSKSKKRRKQQKKRKKKLKKKIKEIVKEMQKILNKQFRNNTRQKQKKTKTMKKFVKKLKEQYKKDRLSFIDLHEEEMVKLDAALMLKLNQIKDLNQDFAKNETFRNIIVSGKMNKAGARMLVEAYPELQPHMLRILRRSGDDDDKFGENLEYDIEYGYAYY